mmetsp:Transcript_12847/g.40974  ORF Transcript_12847/g.40974 Transcript_12847/m.40974 type:complete len:250 (-) Transcript_12847:1694-2443(-)
MSPQTHQCISYVLYPAHMPHIGCRVRLGRQSHARPLWHKGAALAAREGVTRASPPRTAAQDGRGAQWCPAGTGVPCSVRAPPQRPADGGLARDKTRRVFGQRRGLVRDAERLDGKRDGGAVVLRLLARRRERLLLGALLDELLKLLLVAVGGEDEVAGANLRHEVLPRQRLRHVAVARLPRARKHLVLHLHEQQRRLLRQDRQRHVLLVIGVAPHYPDLLLGHVLRAELEPQRDALELPIRVLPAWVVV